MYQNIDIFQQGGAADKDLLDRVVEGYEENVPIPAQILAGFTPPGMAADLVAGGKYGRDAIEEFREGNIKPGLMYAGIAGLSTLGALPLIGDLFRPGKQALKSGIASLPTTKADVMKHQEDLYSGNTIRDANKMFDRAVRSAPAFNQSIDELAASLNLSTSLPGKTLKFDSYGVPVGKIKQVPRAIEKSVDKYEGDVTKLTDPIRTRVLVSTPAEEEALVRLVKENFETFDKGRLVKPEGFVDRKLLIKFTNSKGEPIVGEISAITEPMWRASDANHKAFEEFRSLFPKGMPTDAAERQAINADILRKGKDLEKQMSATFDVAKKQIDPSFYKQDVKKFAMGGYVSAGSSGKSLPITPNLSANADLDIFSPSIKKSATWLGIASVQSDLPGAMKYPSYPKPTGSTTAGPSSHVKNKVSFAITPSLHKFTKIYNPNQINIFDKNDDR